MKEILNPKKTDGSSKNIKLMVYYSYIEEDDGIEYEDSYLWGYFNSVQEVKDYLAIEENKSEIKEYFEGMNTVSLEMCMVNKPYPDSVLVKRLREKSGYEDGMIFCPYCGKWRNFYDNDEGDNTCIVCGISEKNYDVERWKYEK